MPLDINSMVTRANTHTYVKAKEHENRVLEILLVAKKKKKSA